MTNIYTNIDRGGEPGGQYPRWQAPRITLASTKNLAKNPISQWRLSLSQEIRHEASAAAGCWLANA